MSPSGTRAARRPWAQMFAPVARLPSSSACSDEAQVRVDLQRARLHAQRPRLLRRSGMPVDDQRAHAPSRELIREHQPGRAGADDEDVSVQACPP